MMGSKAFESPLVSHARMRGLFRAVVEARELSRVAGRGRGWRKGMEACHAGTALDLKDEDVVSDPHTAWLTDHIRRLGKREAAGAATQRELKRTLRERLEPEVAGAAMSTRDRLVCAIGQSMMLKRAGTGVVLAYADAASMGAAEWAGVLRMANVGDLPLVVVTLPGDLDVSAAAARAGQPALPVIPVDAGDPLAIYRVTQETMIRARGDGGVAVIECIDLKTDPVRQLGRQLVKKGICTERWVEAVAPGVRRALLQAQGA